jgi:hypothetical protein
MTREQSYAEAVETVRTHRPADGDCVLCGELWPCGPAYAADMTVERLWSKVSAVPDGRETE